LDDNRIIVGDDGEVDVVDFELPDKHKRKRKPFRKSIRFTLLALLSTILIVLSAIGAFALYALSQVSGNTSKGICTEHIDQIESGGNKVIFQQRHDGGVGVLQINAMDGVSSHSIERPFDATSADLSEDERWVAESRFIEDQSSDVIFKFSLDDIRLTDIKLTDGKYLSWSPDGSQIAFFRFSGFKDSALYITNADGTDIRHIVDTFGVSAPASWSPDGSQLVFSTTSSEEEPSQSMYIIRSDGTSQYLVVENSLNMTHPAWSPNGEYIAYVSEDVYTIKVDGSGRRNLTNGQFDDTYFPLWSRDSKSLVFLAFKSGHQAIYRMDNDGMGIRQLYAACLP
jgi:hypothetical protein